MATFDEDPSSKPSKEELRLAAQLQQALDTEEPRVAGAAAVDGVPSPGERRAARGSGEAAWLAAHLRVPTSKDALGEISARRLARLARQEAQRRHLTQQTGTPRSYLMTMGRSATGTAGLLALLGGLLLVSYLLLDRGHSGRETAQAQRRDEATSRASGAPSRDIEQVLLLRRSLRSHERPEKRLDLMIRARLAEPSRRDASDTGRMGTLAAGLLAAAGQEILP